MKTLGIFLSLTLLAVFVSAIPVALAVTDSNQNQPQTCIQNASNSGTSSDTYLSATSKLALDTCTHKATGSTSISNSYAYSQLGSWQFYDCAGTLHSGNAYDAMLACISNGTNSQDTYSTNFATYSYPFNNPLTNSYSAYTLTQGWDGNGAQGSSNTVSVEASYPP
jgi:hypothetical protein